LLWTLGGLGVLISVSLDVLLTSAVFVSSFLYTDTLKVLETWGPGCHLLGHSLDSGNRTSTNPHEPPVLALFTEFPSNPLLRSPDLERLRTLSDRYDHLMIVDDTNFNNVESSPLLDEGF